jgi:RNA polymerase sigma factor (sigma-70 family)
MDLATNIMKLLDDTDFDIKAKKDEEILALSIEHPHLFEALLDRYQDALLRKAESILHSREDAEDVVQETFSKIYLYAAKFQIQEGASFKSWAYKILVNTTFTKYQKLKKERGVKAEVDPDWYENMADVTSRQFEKQEASDYVVSVLAKLPEHLSRALFLHVIEGRPQDEVANIEGVSVGAVKTRVHRAKKAFKEIAATFV